MDWPALPLLVLRLALLLAGLLLPGSMLLRALRLPWSLAAAFAASCAILYVVVLTLAATGGPVSLLSLAGALGLIALAGRLVPARRSPEELRSSFSCFTRMGWWLPLYAAFWAVVVYRLVAQPLSGPDVYFRWSYLAEQMVQSGSLNFYPPRSGPDYVRYFWAESIPPGVASLYAWAYACGGAKHAWWTSPVVALQLLSLHEVIWRLASRWGGEAIARRAVLLAAACPLLTWAILIGQETGLTALSVVGLVWCLHHLKESGGLRWAALAGLFAIVGASAREYGPAFAVLAVTLVALQRPPRRQTLVLAFMALPVAIAWPLHGWAMTGNPFYSLDLGGLCPVNPVFVMWNDAFRSQREFNLSSLASWQALARYLALWALPASLGLVALVALLMQRLRDARVVAWFVGLVVVLWFASMAYTAGGLFYSLRVLSPAFALLAIAASYAFGLFIRHPATLKYANVAVALICLEALPKTLVLPENPYRIAARDWPKAGGQFVTAVQAGQMEVLARLQSLPGVTRILTDNAGLPRVLAPAGLQVLPLWSPDAAWLFDSSLKAEEVARRWKKAGYRYLVLGKSGPTAGFVRTYARWRAPYFTVKPVAETETQVILEATVTTPPPS